MTENTDCPAVLEAGVCHSPFNAMMPLKDWEN